MNDRKLKIPQGALAQTKQVCSNELYEIREKQSASIHEHFLRFLSIDLSTYLKVAFIGFIAMMLVQIFIPELYIIPLSIYFFLLGTLSVYEGYKNEYYQTSELFYPVYLHQGRVFLYKNATIAVVEICLLMIISFLQLFLPSLSFLCVFMGSFLPLFFAQIVIIQCTRYIHRLRTAFVVYVGLFVGYLLVYYRFEDTLLAFMSVRMAVFILIISVAVFVLTIYFNSKSKHQEVIHYGIDSRTY